MMRRIKVVILGILVAAAVLFQKIMPADDTGQLAETTAVSINDIDLDSNDLYQTINNNIPDFTDEELHTENPSVTLSELDSLGRCGPAFGKLGTELLPDGEREEIGMVKPTGWHTVKYPNQIEDMYLYNRCHLIAWCLSGINADERNLITGTRYLNVTGMLPYETMTVKYIEGSKNHVLYKVIPVFKGDNLVASGVIMEAWSVEDEGAGICYNVFIRNIQPHICIDYETGESFISE